MIAANTSTWVAFLQGDTGNEAQLLDKAMKERQLIMVPAVLTELPGDPNLPAEVISVLSEVPVIDIGPGFWPRAGALRSKVLAKGRKARLGDALIAQSCMIKVFPS